MVHFLDDRHSYETSALKEVRALRDVLNVAGEYDLSGIDLALSDMEVMDDRARFARTLAWVCGELEEEFGPGHWSTDTQALLRSVRH